MTSKVSPRLTPWLPIYYDAPCMGTCMRYDICTCEKQFNNVKEVYPMTNGTQRPVIGNWPQQLYVYEHKTGYAPTIATDGSAGYDCKNTVPVVLYNAAKVHLVPLGFSVVIPKGFVGLLIPRSSTFMKYGLRLTNTVGVIDSDYRGEVMAQVTLDERSERSIDFHANIFLDTGTPFVQLVIVPCFNQPVMQLSSEEFAAFTTSRGEGGFGSTDKEDNND